jgi:hypothetical protein
MSWLAVYPFDVIKTRLQSNHYEYKGFIDCAIKSYKIEGMKIFMRGMFFFKFEVFCHVW